MTGDLAMLSLALLLALWLRLSDTASLAPTWRHLMVAKLQWWAVLWALWIPASIMSDAYDLKRAAQVVRSALYTSVCAGVVCGLYFLVPIISAPLTFYGRFTWFMFFIFGISGVAIWRAAYAALLARDAFARRMLVVGAGASGSALVEAVKEAGGGCGIEIAGFVDDNESLCGKEIAGHPVLATSGRLLGLVESLGIDEIAVAITDHSTICPQLLDALIACWERGIRIVPMAYAYEEMMGALPIEHVGKSLFALVEYSDGMVLRLWGIMRRLLDLLVGGVGLVAIAPLTPLIALALRLDSPGPILYRQERVGKGGGNFRLTKFRTMVKNAETNGAQWSQDHDPRITRVGWFLRKTRLDELPQFWNLLIGDMTLIGPRPERPEFVPRLGELLPYYRVRHSVKPGLTGWAQVRGGYANSVDDSREKLKYDLYYIKHRGPVLDGVIVLHTMRVMLQMKGH
jgi:exopolysaccharide biosynthesis polyprenyl glycosylphosphotransferase